MWLPSPLYERVPQFWLLLGVLFMACGAYMGFENDMAFVYFGTGSICVVWSIGVLIKRSRFRNKPTRQSIPVANDPDATFQEQSSEQVDADVKKVS